MMDRSLAKPGFNRRRNSFCAAKILRTCVFFWAAIGLMSSCHAQNSAQVRKVLDNQAMQWEDKFYQSNRGHTYLGDPENMKAIYPDFVKIAQGFNVPAERVMYKKDLRAALQRMLDSKEPYLLDVIVPYTEHVLPFIPAGKTVAEMIWKR